MEVTGFVVSAVSIASLFQTCVQVFNLFNAGGQYGKDYEILLCKLEIERVRLLKWGEGLGLLGMLNSEAGITTDPGDLRVIDPDLKFSVDPRIGQLQIGSLVLYILSCLKLLFQDSERLERQYGLKRGDAWTRAGTRTVSELVPSSNTRLNRVYDRLQSHMRKRQRSATFVAKARWAIVDRIKFRTLIDDVKAFNDSLFTLIPDSLHRTVDTMQVIPPFSKTTRGPENLQSSLKRFTLLPARARDLLLELATQIENISFKSASKAQLNDEEDLNRELVEEQAKSNPRGILGSMFYRNGSGVGEESDIYRLKGPGLQRIFVSTLSLPHPALASRHNYKLNVEHCPNFNKFDIEAHPRYEGEIPGTVTIIGYSNACDKYLESLLPEPRIVIHSRRPPTKFSIKYLLDRIMDLKIHGSCPKRIEQGYYCNLKGLPGFTSIVVKNPSEEQLQLQISSMCAWLNSRSFIDFSRIRSITLAAIAPAPKGIGLAKFIHEILLGYDLLLRLQKSEQACSGITEKVWANMLISKLWIENVEVVPKGIEFKLESRVHESQIEGLMKFAEILEWPYITETRNYAENVYSKLRAGQNVPSDLLDWLFGVIMPGRLFAQKVMTALVLATPSLRELGAAQCSQCGLVVSGRSYWRNTTVLGKVLGGIKGVKAAAGWIGPCPPPDDETITGWVKVQARGVVCLNSKSPKSLGSMQSEVERQPERCAVQPRRQADFRQYIAELEDSSQWFVPPPPPSSTQACALKSIQMKQLASSAKQNSVTEYQVSLHFDIDTIPTTYTLYSNPMFITTLPCTGGPHASHSRELQNFQNVFDVANLNTAPTTYDGVLIIVATCDDGEVVGRAWCSERGKHALVRHKETCFTCAMAMTNVCDLVIDVLIWT